MPDRIPEIPLIPSPQTDEARAAVGYRWADPEIGHRHKLGGDPDWVQGSEVPSCTSCREPMTFYGQLDSIGEGFDLADCGLIYVFVCFGCFETRSMLQSY